MHKHLFPVVALIFLCSCASPQKPLAYVHKASSIPDNAVFALKLPATPVVYNGEVSYDNAGAPTGQMLYPAPTAGAFLAAIMTHAVVADSMQSAEKTKLQDAANGVVSGYRETLRDFTHAELGASSLKSTGVAAGKLTLWNPDQPVTADLILESRPTFILSQDRGTLMLQNTVAAYPVGHPDKIVYQNIIEVVSDIVTDSDLNRYWNRNNGEPMKQLSAKLLADSLRMAIDDADRESGPDAQNHAYQTVHYQQGAVEKIERAELVARDCDRMTLRTLRGWLRSVPVVAGASATDCTSH